MNPNEIKQIYSEGTNKPKMKVYLLILVGVLLLVGFFYLVTNYTAIADTFSNGEQPPALPPENNGEENTLPDAGSNDFPQLPP
jgi:hypothetical protein